MPSLTGIFEWSSASVDGTGSQLHSPYLGASKEWPVKPEPDITVGCSESGAFSSECVVHHLLLGVHLCPGILGGTLKEYLLSLQDFFKKETGST